MTEQRRFSRLGFAVAEVLVVLLISTSGCSSSGRRAKVAKESTTTTQVAANTLQTSLRAAAVAWAKAFFSPIPAEISEMSPQCRPLPQQYVKQYREDILREFGVNPIATIRGVLTRNVTASSGEAEVQYDLPESLTGNDNWVLYDRSGGKWKLDECIEPIGGVGSSTSGTVPAKQLCRLAAMRHSYRCQHITPAIRPSRPNPRVTS